MLRSSYENVPKKIMDINLKLISIRLNRWFRRPYFVLDRATSRLNFLKPKTLCCESPADEYVDE